MAKKILTPIESANKARKKEARKEQALHTRKIFSALCTSIGISEPVPEYKFHPERLWRFDYCWPDKKIALEVEGGIFTGGAHTRGAHFSSDMEKYNQAVVHGWRLIRTTPSLLLTKGTSDLIRQLYNQTIKQ